MQHFNASLLQASAAAKGRYFMMRDAPPSAHPCKHKVLGECYRSFAAALTVRAREYSYQMEWSAHAARAAAALGVGGSFESDA